MADGFSFDHAFAAGEGELEEIRSVAATQYQEGDMLAYANGVGAKVTAAGKGTHVVETMKTPDALVQQATYMLSTAAQEDLLAFRVKGGKVVLRSALTGTSAPPINNLPCKANASPTSLLVDFAGANNDFQNGTCYVPEIGQQREITADAQAGGQKTFTVAPAFSRAPTTGDTVRAVPWAKGNTVVKFDATTPHRGIGTAVGDKSGGNNEIFEVDLANYIVRTIVPAVS